ncbi:hypothetical protein QFC21_005200 [Naganishia friedmannii]|uniref:Uncharacterized protein n=1 Tax=Naganishia friedmannii TaxID=89922 RepID=A0ACC2VBC5_9TREE|nr:hypothetical protein QFC21_005200 [Naganishia friedmannii]
MSASIQGPTPSGSQYASRIIIGLEEAGFNMDTPDSSNPASDAEPYQDQAHDLLDDDDDEETDIQIHEPYEPSPFQQLQGRNQPQYQQHLQQQVSGQKGPRRSYMNKEGKNAVPVIDVDVLKRWDIEIGDVLADSATTSNVILPGPAIPPATFASAGPSSLPPPPPQAAQRAQQPPAAPPVPQQPPTEPLVPAK